MIRSQVASTKSQFKDNLKTGLEETSEELRAFARLHMITQCATIRKEINNDLAEMEKKSLDWLNIAHHVDHVKGSNMVRDGEGLYKRFSSYFIDNDKKIKKNI